MNGAVTFRNDEMTKSREIKKELQKKLHDKRTEYLSILDKNKKNPLNEGIVQKDQSIKIEIDMKSTNCIIVFYNRSPKQIALFDNFLKTVKLYKFFHFFPFKSLFFITLLLYLNYHFRLHFFQNMDIKYMMES